MPRSIAGVDVGCFRYYEEGSCIEHSHCSWSPGAFSCHRTEQSVPCERFNEEEPCRHEGSGCLWDKTVGTCIAPGTVIPCNRYFEKEQCDSKHDDCEWHKNMCMKVGTYVPCDEITKQSICNNQPCFWNRDAKVCEEHADEGHSDAGDDAPPAPGGTTTGGEAPPHNGTFAFILCLRHAGCPSSAGSASAAPREFFSLGGILRRPLSPSLFQLAHYTCWCLRLLQPIST